MKGSVPGTVLVLLLVSGQTASARQVSPRAASAVLAGALVAADNGQPVRKAVVRLTSASPRMVRTTTSDGEGRWSFIDLPAGEYTLSAARPGYLEMVYGARQPGAARRGTPIRIDAGQRIETLSLPLPRAAVISGIVTDEFGDPAHNVSVRALRYVFANGERIVQTAASAVTDDRGEYRVAGLAPGEYLVTAVPRDTVAAAAAQARSLDQRRAQVGAAARAGDADARAAAATMTQARREGRMPPAPPTPVGYVPMYYPGTPTPATAAAVSVGLSEQVFGIDVRLEIVETATIAGTVLDTEGEPIQGNVKLIDPAMPVSGVGAWFTSSDPDGRFSFAGIVPGAYVLGANNSPPGTIGSPPESGGPFQMAAPAPVAVTGGDVSDVEVRTRPALTVSGRLDLDGLDATVDRSQVRLNLVPVTRAADWEMAVFRVVPDDDGRFVLDDVIAARYRIGVGGLPDGWRVASAMFNARDAADHHLAVTPGERYEGGVVTITNRSAELGGTVTDAQGGPVDRNTVVLFPSDRALWIPQSRRIRVAQTGPDGRYTLQGLPDGEYRLAVVTEIEAGREFDAEFLGGLAGASLSVTLSDGRTTVQNLRVR